MTKNYHNVKQLYLTAFPKFERFPILQLMLLALKSQIYFEGVYDHDQFAGLTFTVEGETAVYLAYLAIAPDKRGHGYGTKVLKDLKKRFLGKQIILDIEPVDAAASNYKQRVKRLKFYQQNGFNLTKRKLVDDSGTYQVCTTGNRVNIEEFNQILQKMGSFNRYTIE